MAVYLSPNKKFSKPFRDKIQPHKAEENIPELLNIKKSLQMNLESVISGFWKVLETRHKEQELKQVTIIFEFEMHRRLRLALIREALTHGVEIGYI